MALGRGGGRCGQPSVGQFVCGEGETERASAARAGLARGGAPPAALRSRGKKRRGRGGLGTRQHNTGWGSDGLAAPHGQGAWPGGYRQEKHVRSGKRRQGEAEGEHGKQGRAGKWGGAGASQALQQGLARRQPFAGPCWRRAGIWAIQENCRRRWSVPLLPGSWADWPTRRVSKQPWPGLWTLPAGGHRRRRARW